jgi:hypothetical protein
MIRLRKTIDCQVFCIIEAKEARLGLFCFVSYVNNNYI